MMLEIGTCAGIENYSRHLSGRAAGERPACLFDYFPEDFLVVVDESHVTLPQIGGMFNGDRARKLTLVDYGFRLPSALDNRPLMFDEFLSLTPRAVVRLGDAGRARAAAVRGRGRRADHPADGADRSRDRGAAGARAGGRPAQRDPQARERKGERVLVTTLTKRMSEDLTDYLQQMGVRVRYMHSDIDAIERMEIVRGLRLGEFDVLVGINLLREGLDLPEVSLVAILDADQEGFLRSDRSLIQTVGRAARHVNGRAIFYADRITGSMQRCIDETDAPPRDPARAQRGARHHADVGVRRASTRCGSSRAWPMRAERDEERETRSARKVAEPRRRATRWSIPRRSIAMLEQQMREAATASTSRRRRGCATSCSR